MCFNNSVNMLNVTIDPDAREAGGLDPRPRPSYLLSTTNRHALAAIMLKITTKRLCYY